MDTCISVRKHYKNITQINHCMNLLPRLESTLYRGERVGWQYWVCIVDNFLANVGNSGVSPLVQSLPLVYITFILIAIYQPSTDDVQSLLLSSWLTFV